MGLDARRTGLRMAWLPRALRRLKAHEVEDVLCIFKERFAATVRGVRRSWVDDARTKREILPARGYNACG